MASHDRLDPELAAAIQLIPFDDINADLLPMLRMRFEMPVSDRVERTDRVVPGDPEVPVRVHRAKDAGGVQAGLLTIHGGGYVIGTNLLDDPILDAWCPSLGIVGVSVDYRLAPDTQYPGPLEDCYRALQWTHANAAELGIDPSRIGVMGVSAGGGLAAALCLLARDRGEVPIAFQLLDSPMLDDRQATPSSRDEGLAVWTKASNTFGWKAYLGELYGGDVPYTAAPARADDLSGLPPALVSVGAVDGFRDEDVDYATRLNQAGVPAALHVYPRACHGFTSMAPGAALTHQAMANMTAWLRAELARD